MSTEIGSAGRSSVGECTKMAAGTLADMRQMFWPVIRTRKRTALVSQGSRMDESRVHVPKVVRNLAFRAWCLVLAESRLSASKAKKLETRHVQAASRLACSVDAMRGMVDIVMCVFGWRSVVHESRAMKAKETAARATVSAKLTRKVRFEDQAPAEIGGAEVYPPIIDAKVKTAEVKTAEVKTAEASVSAQPSVETVAIQTFHSECEQSNAQAWQVAWRIAHLDFSLAGTIFVAWRATVNHAIPVATRRSLQDQQSSRVWGKLAQLGSTRFAISSQLALCREQAQCTTMVRVSWSAWSWLLERRHIRSRRARAAAVGATVADFRERLILIRIFTEWFGMKKNRRRRITHLANSSDQGPCSSAVPVVWKAWCAVGKRRAFRQRAASRSFSRHERDVAQTFFLTWERVWKASASARKVHAVSQRLDAWSMAVERVSVTTARQSDEFLLRLSILSWSAARHGSDIQRLQGMLGESRDRTLNTARGVGQRFFMLQANTLAIDTITSWRFLVAQRRHMTVLEEAHGGRSRALALQGRTACAAIEISLLYHCWFPWRLESVLSSWESCRELVSQRRKVVVYNCLQSSTQSAIMPLLAMFHAAWIKFCQAQRMALNRLVHRREIRIRNQATAFNNMLFACWLVRVRQDVKRRGIAFNLGDKIRLAASFQDVAVCFSAWKLSCQHIAHFRDAEQRKVVHFRLMVYVETNTDKIMSQSLRFLFAIWLVAVVNSQALLLEIRQAEDAQRSRRHNVTDALDGFIGRVFDGVDRFSLVTYMRPWAVHTRLKRSFKGAFAMARPVCAYQEKTAELKHAGQALAFFVWHWALSFIQDSLPRVEIQRRDLELYRQVRKHIPRDFNYSFQLALLRHASLHAVPASISRPSIAQQYMLQWKTGASWSPALALAETRFTRCADARNKAVSFTAVLLDSTLVVLAWLLWCDVLRSKRESSKVHVARVIDRVALKVLLADTDGLLAAVFYNWIKVFLQDCAALDGKRLVDSEEKLRTSQERLSLMFEGKAARSAMQEATDCFFEWYFFTQISNERRCEDQQTRHDKRLHYCVCATTLFEIRTNRQGDNKMFFMAWTTFLQMQVLLHRVSRRLVMEDVASQCYYTWRDFTWHQREVSKVEKQVRRKTLAMHRVLGRCSVKVIFDIFKEVVRTLLAQRRLDDMKLQSVELKRRSLRKCVDAVQWTIEQASKVAVQLWLSSLLAMWCLECYIAVEARTREKCKITKVSVAQTFVVAHQTTHVVRFAFSLWSYSQKCEVAESELVINSQEVTRKVKFDSITRVLNVCSNMMEDVAAILGMRLAWEVWAGILIKSSLTKSLADNQKAVSSMDRKIQDLISDFDAGQMAADTQITELKHRSSLAPSVVGSVTKRGIEQLLLWSLVAWFLLAAQRQIRKDNSALFVRTLCTVQRVIVRATTQIATELTRAVVLRWQYVLGARRKTNNFVRLCSARSTDLVRERGHVIVSRWKFYACELRSCRSLEFAQLQGKMTIGSTTVRLHNEANRLLTVVTLLVWSEMSVASRCAKRVVDSSACLFQCWARAFELSWAKVIFSVWTEVLIVVQTAAMRAGLRESSLMVAAMAAEESGRVAQTQQLQEGMRAARIIASFITSRLSSDGITRFLAGLIIRLWKSAVARLKCNRSIICSFRRHTGRGVLRGYCLAWFHVRGKRRTAAECLEAKAVTRRCRSSIARGLDLATWRTSIVQSLILVTAVWRAWSFDSFAAKDARRPVLLSRCRTLAGVTFLLWNHDQLRSFLRLIMAMWHWAVRYSTAERHAGLAHSRNVLLHGIVEHAKQVRLRDVERHVRRLAASCNEAALLATFATWHRFTVGSGRGLGPGDLGVARLSLAQWRGDLDASRFENKWWQMRKATRNNCATLVARFATKCSTEAVPPALAVGFLRWRLCVVDGRRVVYKAELQMVVNLLQQSTLTCKELRTQLLGSQNRQERVAPIIVWATLHAWNNCCRRGASSALTGVSPSLRIRGDCPWTGVSLARFQNPATSLGDSHVEPECSRPGFASQLRIF